MEKQNQFTFIRLFLAALFFMCLPFANVAVAEIASGTSGTCTWTISDDSILTIKPTEGESGTLASWSSSASAVPWYANRTKVKKVIVESGVAASTCAYFFNGMSNCTEMDLSGLTTTGVTNFTNMFYSCSKLTTVNVSTFDTSSGTSFSATFGSCSKLTTLDLSKWSTVEGTNFSFMFQSCTNLATLNVSSFDVSKGTNFTKMFNDCKALTTIDVSNWNPKKGTAFTQMFSGCSKLTTLNVSNWNTESAKEFSYMFNSCPKLASLDVSNWNTKSVTGFGQMFCGCSSLTSLDVSKWNTAAGTNFAVMFKGCSKLTSLDVSDWNTAAGTNFSYMFADCTKLTSLDVSEWNNAAGTNFSYMFSGCTGLTSLDVSGFKTPKGTNFSYMFQKCSKLTSLNVSDWSTAAGTNFSYMFSGCTGLTSLDVSNWSTVAGTNFSSMFSSCTGLTSLDVSNFSTSKGTTFNNMFNGCSALTKLDLSSFEMAPTNTAGYSGFITGTTSLDTLITPKTIDNTNDVLKIPYIMRDWTKGEIIAANGEIPAGCHLLTRSYKPRTTLNADLEDENEEKVSGYWGTMYTDIPVSVPEGITAYYAIPYEDALSTVAFVKVEADVLPAGGYLLCNDESAEQNKFVFQNTASTTIDSETNVLKGDTTKVSDSEEGYYYYYLTTYKGENPGFYWKSGTKGKSITMSAFKCYLKVPEKYVDGEDSETGTTTRSFSYMFLNHNELTGIDQVACDKRQATSDTYDLQGRKVKTMQRGGLYIKNGKVILNR